MTNKTIFSFIFLAISIAVCAQEAHTGHKGHHHDEGHPKNELGISLSPVYFFKEKGISAATHLHYAFHFPASNFGVGVGYERIFDEHRHNFLGVELFYKPVHRLTINLSPGVAFEDTHFDEKEFALHFESVYAFEIKSFHIGPSLEFGYHPEDFHISLGIHAGFGF